MKIAMVTEYAYPLPGGVSEHVHFLSRELVRMGHEVTVISGRLHRQTGDHDRRLATKSGYRIVRVGHSLPFYINGSIARLTLGPRVRVRLKHALRGMDVIHAQGLASPSLPIMALSGEAPVITGTFHTYFTPGKHLLFRLCYHWVGRGLNRLHRRIAVSSACIEALDPIFPGNWDIIPNGIDCELFRPLGPDERRPEGPPRILFVGRFDPRNALDVLLDAAALLRDRGHDFVIDVVGDGPTRSVYERQARRLDLWDRITWHGLVIDGRDRLYREATVFACPCTLASFGVVLLEAMASGTPIVACDNIGFRQVIRDSAPGRFVPPRDATALAEGIEELLADPARRADWAVRGREAAVTRYSWASVARQVEGLYREVLHSNGLSGGGI